MLLKLTERCRVPVRLDSVAGGAQTGHKVSAVYFIGRCCTTTAEGAAADKTGKGRRVSKEYDVSPASDAGAGGQLRLQNIEAAAPLAEGLGAGDGDGDGDSGSTNSSNGTPATADPQEGRHNDNGDKNGDGSNTSTSGGGGRCSPAPAPAPPRSGSGREKGAARQRQGQGKGQGVVLEPTADRLVLFRSDRVSTETLEVLGRGQEQYAVLFWMHEAKEEVG